MTIHSTTFAPDIDPDKRTYNIHLIAEIDAPDAELGQTAITSKDLLAALEKLLTKEHGFTMVASQCGANDGEFASIVWVDDDPVSFNELINAYRQQEERLERGDTVEIFQRTDMKWDWRVFAENTNLIASSGGQGYERVADAATIVHALFRGFPVGITGLHKETVMAKFDADGFLTWDAVNGERG
jgi:uncharacterized protein YegP (UPF0339 family)